jgi:hypothetical protein
MESPVQQNPAEAQDFHAACAGSRLPWHPRQEDKASQTSFNQWNLLFCQTAGVYDAGFYGLDQPCGIETAKQDTERGPIF